MAIEPWEDHDMAGPVIDVSGQRPTPDDSPGERPCPECGREPSDRRLIPIPGLFHWRRFAPLLVFSAVLVALVNLAANSVDNGRRTDTLPLSAANRVAIDRADLHADDPDRIAVATAALLDAARSAARGTPPLDRLDAALAVDIGLPGASRTRHAVRRGFPFVVLESVRTETRMSNGSRMPIETDETTGAGLRIFHSVSPGGMVGPRPRVGWYEGRLIFSRPPEETGGRLVFQTFDPLAFVGLLAIAFIVSSVAVVGAVRVRRGDDLPRSGRWRIALTLVIVALCMGVAHERTHVWDGFADPVIFSGRSGSPDFRGVAVGGGVPRARQLTSVTVADLTEDATAPAAARELLDAARRASRDVDTLPVFEASRPDAEPAETPMVIRVGVERDSSASLGETRIDHPLKLGGWDRPTAATRGHEISRNGPRFGVARHEDFLLVQYRHASDERQDWDLTIALGPAVGVLALLLAASVGVWMVGRALVRRTMRRRAAAGRCVACKYQMDDTA